MQIRQFIRPLVFFTSPFWGAVASGLYELVRGRSLDMDIVNSPLAWYWFFGTISGFLILDLSRPIRSHSFLLSLYDNRKNPLSFVMCTQENMPPGCHFDTTIGAYVENSSPIKRKNACVVSRDSRGCGSNRKVDIEFCLDIPAQTKVFLPMFDVKLEGDKVLYRFRPDYLKSNRVSSDWCELSEAAFLFKPCFSDDMNQEKCLRVCTVEMPNAIRNSVKLTEEYYADNEEDKFNIA